MMEQKIAGILGTEEFVEPSDAIKCALRVLNEEKEELELKLKTAADKEAVKINERLAEIDKTIEEVNGYYKGRYGGRLVF